MKLALRISGLVITVLCLTFVIRRFLHFGPELTIQLFTQTQWIWALVLSLIYGLSLFSLAWAWATLAHQMSGESNHSIPALMRMYGQSSIAKYLPGNIFHYAGRQVLGAQGKVAQAPLAFATLFEMLISVVVVLFLSSLLLAFSSLLESTISRMAWVISSALLLILCAGTPLLSQITSRFSKRFVSHSIQPVKPPTLTKVHLQIFLFFTCMAMIAIYAVVVLDDGLRPSVFMGGAYLLAWLAGFIVPGVAGGIGVREAAMLGLMTPECGEETVLLLAFFTRLISTVGDIIFWLGSFLLPRTNTGGGNIST